MLATLATAGSLLFWGFIILWVISEWIFIHNEKWELCFIDLVVLLVLITFLTDVQLGWWYWIRDNFTTILFFWIPLYVLAAAVWAPVKWYFYLLRKVDEYQKYYRDPINRDFNSQLINKDPVTDFKKYAAKRGYPPSARENKARILVWMIWWWISIIDTVLTDFIHRVFEVVYEQLASLLQKISDSVFHNRFEEFHTKKDPNIAGM